jgi:ubiquinone/menaquinone biosynthesis C-methylase UbiE
MAQHRAAECNDDLELYLRQVSEIFDIPCIIDERQEKSQIMSYYSANRLTYRLSYSWEGFVHCGLSYDGRRKKEDLKEQVRIIEQYIREMKAQRVLELGSGFGANSAYLARRNPQVTFDAVDFSTKPLKRFAKIPNIRFHCGDYHDLTTFEDNAYDAAFVIEALCHSTNKQQALREVKKKLRPGGIFVVIDVYQTNRATRLNRAEDLMWQLITRGAASEPFERVNDVENYMRDDYSVIVTTNMSQYVLPTFERQKSLVRYYFSHPFFAKTVNRFVPLEIAKNSIVVLLLPTSVRRKILCYYLHVLQKEC